MASVFSPYCIGMNDCGTLESATVAAAIACVCERKIRHSHRVLHYPMHATRPGALGEQKAGCDCSLRDHIVENRNRLGRETESRSGPGNSLRRIWPRIP